MKCPVCKIDMIVVEYKKIELDYCTNCTGAWFDSGELELFLQGLPGGKAALSQLLTPPETQPAEKKHKCPICGRKMDKTFAGKEPSVVIDACPKGEGLWFDGGELEQVVKKLGQPSGKGESNEVISFLGEVFQAHPRAQD